MGAERSLHDAIMVVRRALKTPSVVAGGGAIEMELSRYLREYARSIRGKAQILINAFAKALEIIPRQLASNAGFGVDIMTGDICDTFESFVWEPVVMTQNAVASAAAACNSILLIDETVKAPQSQQMQNALPGQH